MKNLFKKPGGHNSTDERIGHLLGEAVGSLQEYGGCPHPEDIAALSEGKITGDNREHLLLHLARCDRCRAAYSMVCEIAKVEVTAASTGFRWQARRIVPLAAAAGLILAIVSWPLLEHRESPVEVSTNPEARIHVKEKLERAPVPTAQAVPRPTIHPARPLAPMPEKLPAKECKPADADSNIIEVPKQVDEFAPHFVAAPVTKASEPPQEPLNLHRRVTIDEGQRSRLSKADAATSDKVKIEGIFNELKLDACGFPLQDVNKVVVQWVKVPRYRKRAAVTEPLGPANAQADISLLEGGVLKIVVQENIIMRAPAINAVGC